MTAIEVVGANRKSMGDLLMLEAVRQALRRQGPEIVFAVRQRRVWRAIAPGRDARFLPLLKRSRRRQGLTEALNRHLLSPLSAVAGLLPGWVSAGRISGLVDVCGYKYGGIRGRAAIEFDLRNYSAERRRGRKIILMPKTFGPFEDRETKARMRELAACCDLCFTRDQISHAHLVDAGVPPERCPIFPDFTGVVRGVVSDAYRGLAGKSLIIPNYRMVDAGIGLTETGYLAHLQEVSHFLRQQEGGAAILVHDFGKDPELARCLAHSTNLPLIEDRRALVVRGLIGQARVVYSDRLHGLINALNQGVPGTTVGWGHKYNELLKAYGLPSPSRKGAGSLSGAVIEVLATLLSERARYSLHLRTAGESIARENHLMWERIRDCLFGPRPDSCPR